MNTSVPVTNTQDVLIGRVKWFNNKSGFGFITITDGPTSGADIFVHHSAVKVDSEQYKYLVQGEYVEFTLIETQDSKHACQASNVCGIKGGKLMCETRRDFRSARNSYRGSTEEQEQEQEQVQQQQQVQQREIRRTPKVRGAGPREESDWTYVAKGKNDKKTSTSRPPRKIVTSEV